MNSHAKFTYREKNHSDNNIIAEDDISLQMKRIGINKLRYTIRRFVNCSPIGSVALIGLIIIVLVAIFARFIAPHDPLTTDYLIIKKPPYAEHWLGTDLIGRDVFSRVLFGLQISLLVAIAAVILGNGAGFLLGLFSAYVGGTVDLIIMRLVEILMAFPALILALLLMAGLGQGMVTVIIAIAITHIPASCRITRSVVLSSKETTFVEAARATGVPTTRIMMRHVAPESFSPNLVAATMALGSAIFAEAALSFLGQGVPPPTPSLGNMLGEGLASQFNPPWWLVTFPGLMITLIILCANLFGDALRDYLDPRLKNINKI
jgi:ABC-type dipeptide/oligopeptide/nickel transport system permease subunit